MADELPKVSVIIPCHNCSEFVSETIASVRGQTLTEWELFLVDDGSSDATADIARGYAALDDRIRYLWQPNAGAAAARNRGLREVDPAVPLVAFLDSDDIWMPEALYSLVSLVESTRAVVAYGLPDCFGENGSMSNPQAVTEWSRHRFSVEHGRRREFDITEPTNLGAMLCHCWIATPGQAVINAAAFRRVGGFDESLRNSEDWDLWIRLAFEGSLSFLDRVVVKWRMHEGNKSSDPRRMERAERTIRRKYRRSADPAMARLARESERYVLRTRLRSKLAEIGPAFREGGLRAAARSSKYTLRPSYRIVRFYGDRLRDQAARLTGVDNCNSAGGRAAHLG